MYIYIYVYTYIYIYNPNKSSLDHHEKPPLEIQDRNGEKPRCFLIEYDCDMRRIDVNSSILGFETQQTKTFAQRFHQKQVRDLRSQCWCNVVKSRPENDQRKIEPL